MTASAELLGIVAGSHSLPLLFARQARTLGVKRLVAVAFEGVVSESEGLSHAEIDQACRDAIKQAILTDKEKVSASLLEQMLRERQNAHGESRG